MIPKSQHSASPPVCGPANNRILREEAGRGTNLMYGLIAKITTVPGKRDEFIGILEACTGDMPGCHSYVVAKDAADEVTVWVTEAWDRVESHDASLTLPEVKQAVLRGKPLVAAFEKVAVTNPVCGVRLTAAHAQPRV
jgi:quinol monooxygenase YgiN